MSRPHPVTFRPSADLTSWLKDRAARSFSQAGIGSRAQTELLLWRRALQAELAIQRWTLTELGAIAAALDHTLITEAVPGSIGRCAVEVTDARRGQEEDWDAGIGDGFAGDHLVAKLARLGPTADMALVDAISRWWDAGLDHSPEGWAEVGVQVASGPVINLVGSLRDAPVSSGPVANLAGSLRSGGPIRTVEEMDAALGRDDG